MIPFIDSIISRTARRTLNTLTTRGLIREGLYLAANTWFDGWKEPAANALGTGFLAALSNVLDDREYHTWRKLFELRKDSSLNESILRLVAQSPDAAELIERTTSGDYSPHHLAEKLVFVGNKLIESEKYDAGLSVLACSTHSDLAGEDALRVIQIAVGNAPRRFTRVPNLMSPIVVELGTAAMRLASTGHFGAAVHTRFLMPLLAGDIGDFKRLGYLALNVRRPHSMFANLHMHLCNDLYEKGYRTQAIELLTSATGITQGDQQSWKQVYDVIKEPEHTTATSRILTKLGAPAVIIAGMDLRPISETKPAAPTETDQRTVDHRIPSPTGAPRRVNAWLKEHETYPPNEFDVWANIGPPREGAMGGEFKGEPDWDGREFIDLRLVLSGLNAEVRPGWHEVRLPRVGKTEDVSFRVKSKIVGRLHLRLRVYAAKEMLLLDEHDLTIELEREKQLVA